jgi:uncharacterized protein (DUF433 family)
MANKQQAYNGWITINPKVMVGKLVVKGTRIPVERVVAHLANNLDWRNELTLDLRYLPVSKRVLSETSVDLNSRVNPNTLHNMSCKTSKGV